MKTVPTLALILCVVLVSLAAPLGPGQEERGSPAFPDGWIGSYRGQLEVMSPRGGQRVGMEFELAATEDPDRYRWIIGYEGQPKRNYELVVIDRDQGRYLIDERNSIEVEARFLGGELISVFAVSGSRLVTRYRLDGDALRFEVITSSAEATGTTGGEGGAPEVELFQLRGVQRAAMTRADASPAMSSPGDVPRR